MSEEKPKNFNSTTLVSWATLLVMFFGLISWAGSKDQQINGNTKDGADNRQDLKTLSAQVSKIEESVIDLKLVQATFSATYVASQKNIEEDIKEINDALKELAK